MRFSRTLAPSAAPLGLADLVYSLVDVFVPGRASARLQRQFQNFLGRDHVFFVSSGQAALTIALRSMRELRPARKVVIPAYTCYSLPAAIIRAGLEPVLVDLNPETLGFDEASLRSALDQPDILCVVPTHLFGIATNIDLVRTEIGARGIFILEDAAQGLGLDAPDGRRLGSIGDVSIFSFGRGKHVTCGHGGMISTSSPEIAALCRKQCDQLPGAGAAGAIRVWVELLVMSLFLDPRLYWLPSGLPFLGLGKTTYDVDFPMTQLPATGLGALRRWRTRLDGANRARLASVKAWCWTLELNSTTAPQVALLRLPLLLQSKELRDALVEAGHARGLGASRMYPLPIHRISEIKDRFAGQRFPGAEAIADRLVTLPTHGAVVQSDRVAFAALWREAQSVPSARRAQAVPLW